MLLSRKECQRRRGDPVNFLSLRDVYASKHRGDPVNLVSLRDICVSKCRGSPAGGAFVPGLLRPYGLAMTTLSPRDCFAQPPIVPPCLL